MATIDCVMSALGNEPNGCNGCGKRFERGESMMAVIYDDGEPAGWFDNECIEKWKRGEIPEGGD